MSDYTPTGAPPSNVKGNAAAIRNEFAAIAAAIASKAGLLSPNFTGTPTAPTASAGTSSTQLATCAFVVAQAFTSALPGQTGNAGKILTTDGTNASWTSNNPLNNAVYWMGV